MPCASDHLTREHGLPQSKFSVQIKPPQLRAFCTHSDSMAGAHSHFLVMPWRLKSKEWAWYFDAEGVVLWAVCSISLFTGFFFSFY